MNKEAFLGRTLTGRFPIEQASGKKHGYRIERFLGQGTFGMAFAARYEHDNALVAVKLFDEVSNPLEVLQEARMLSYLHHPHIVPFHWFDIEQIRYRDEGRNREFVGNYPFIVMEYASGGNLRDFRQKDMPLAPAQAVEFLLEAADAMQHVHDKKILHRDLKPANLLLRKHPQTDHLDLLVSDFGIAIKAHTEGSLEPHGKSGTLAYMAPEQAKGRTVRESDQYGLGIIAYEWLTGRLPFLGDALQLEVAHARQTPPSFRETLRATGNEQQMDTYGLLILDALQEVVMKALEKNPQARHHSLADFAQTLQEAHTKAVEEAEKQRRAFEAPTVCPQQQPDLASARSLAADVIKRGNDLFKQDKSDEALQAYEQAIQLDPTISEAYLEKGNVLHALGRYEESLQVCDEVIRLYPNDSFVFKRKGDFLYNLCRYEEALQAYDKAIKLNPNDFPAFYYKGCVLENMCRYEEALRVGNDDWSYFWVSSARLALQNLREITKN